ncbi:acyltransferase family protein [Curtobacterium pusillum]|uniref:acyltransferase family protein n=1 Tax=Curtobacterium pusillum TaxID=69373 RepID=UPI001643545F|nr:acyltransferase family protein [Curtobacterium pusillum]
MRNQRRDIQGLRALAVTAVVLSHFWGWPRGGFVGVDVFFVISGFLITGHLVREHATTGRISFVDFYAKRIRRIAPAAAVVLIVTVGASAFLLNPNRASDVRGDGVWAAVFLANWHFAQTGTDYFTADGPSSPLQHFWSLAIEEQFYAVWPLLIVVVLRHRPARSRIVRPTARLAGLCGGVIVLSLCWAAWSTHAAPTSAYFSTGARAWELAVGAMLAVGARYFQQLPQWAREALAWAGLAGITAAYVIADGAHGFPFPTALLPTLGTALVIAAGVGSEPRSLFVLRNPLTDYVGRVSYSLYLWHFPVLVLAVPVLAAALGRSNPLVLIAALLLAVGFAVSSFHFVEEPVRRSRWLVRRPGRRHRIPANTAVAITVSAMAVLSSGAALTVDGRSSRASASEFANSATAEPHDTADTGARAGRDESEQDAITALVEEANKATAWPDDLAVNDPDAPDALPGAAGVCGSAEWLDAEECTIGSPDAPKTAVLAGDSIAQAYTPALATLFGTGEWKLRMVSMYACPFVALELGDQPNRIDSCAERKKLEVQEVKRLKPDVLIIANTYIRNVDRSGERPSVGEWSAALADQVSRTAGAAKRTFYLLPPPQTPDVRECYTPISKPKDCAGRVSDTDWKAMARAQTAALRAQKVSVIDSLPWFCTSGGSCPAFGGTAMMRNDSWHPSPTWTTILAPAMREAFAAAGGLGG